MTARERITSAAALLTVILVALLTRFGAVIVPLKDFDSDEAVVGLMAREILAGGAWPVFYAGQSYLGALEPWSVAASFALLGESPFGLRLVPLLYSLVFLIALRFLLRRFFRPAETWLILLWTALGTPFFNLWAVKARGGFAELLLLGTLFLLVFESSWRLRRPGVRSLSLLGGVAAFGLFVNPLVGTLMVVPLVMLTWRAFTECRPLLTARGWTIKGLACFRPLHGRARMVFLVLAGVGLLALALAAPVILVGDEALESRVGVSVPDGTDVATYVLLYFALLYVAELAALSRPLPGGFAALLRGTWAESAGFRMLLVLAASHLFFSIAATRSAALLGGGGHDQPLRLAPLILWPERVLLVFGEIVPTATWRLAGLSGLLMAALCVWSGALLFQQRGELDFGDDGSPKPICPLLLFGGTTIATMLLVVTSAYTQDAAAARYLLPLLVSLPPTAYLLVDRGVSPRWRRQAFRIGLLSLLSVGIAAGALWGRASMLSPRSSGSPYPGLVRELESRGGETFIADYGTAYPLAFLAGGRIAVAPADGPDRFPAVSAAIRSVGPDAYVFLEESAPLAEFYASSQATNAREELVRPGPGGPLYHLFYVYSR